MKKQARVHKLLDDIEDNTSSLGTSLSINNLLLFFILVVSIVSCSQLVYPTETIEDTKEITKDYIIGEIDVIGIGSLYIDGVHYTDICDRDLVDLEVGDVVYIEKDKFLFSGCDRYRARLQ